MDRLNEPMLLAINHEETGTVIYFKGCSLRCLWCPSPEAISPNLEIVLDRENCIACCECVHGCPQKAITLDKNILYRDKGKCDLCLNCVEICPSLVFSTVGERYTCKQVMEQIETHLPLQNQISHSVLFTGGEPLMQPEPLIHILDKCGDIPIRRVVNTTGFVPTKVLLEVAQRTDMFLYTVRHMNSATHKQMTGQPNELILHNLHELAATGTAVRIRMVLIKDVNDNEENIRATGSFLSGLEGVNEVYLLSLDDLRSSGAHNETTLSLQTNSLIPEGKSMARAKTILQDYGLLVTSH